MFVVLLKVALNLHFSNCFLMFKFDKAFVKYKLSFYCKRTSESFGNIAAMKSNFHIYILIAFILTDPYMVCHFQYLLKQVSSKTFTSKILIP